MTKVPESTIYREVVQEAVRLLGLDPSDITQLFIDSHEIKVFHRREHEDSGLRYSKIKVI